MNTHESYVSLETAKLLKDAGFDWECPNMYLFTVRGHEIHGMYKGWMPSPKDYWCPSLDVAQRWLREVKECAVIVETHNVQAACVSAYVYCIYPTDATHPCKHINGFAEDYCFNTYEEALEAGVKKALEIILERGD